MIDERNNKEYKHLVDLYSYSLLEDKSINIGQIKEFVSSIFKYRNNIRKSHDEKEPKPNLHIVDKDFKGSYILLALQAGHNISKTYMIDRVNDYLLRIEAADKV